MAENSDSGHSSVDGPTTAFASSDRPPSIDGPETVVNPERRAAAQAPLAAASKAGSTVWNRLFPSDSQIQEGGADLDPTGVRIAHFVIERRIGTGGMGAVFRAVDQRLQRPVALKILSPAQSRDAASVGRFQNEARAAARMCHENIAGVYYIGEDHGLHFIAYEFISGTNVRQLIQDNGRLDPADAVNYTLQIARALMHTASAGVVHRDIKPSNIIITTSGQAKLVDLGLARKQTSDATGELTLAGTTLGTFDYISPEQAKDPRNVDVRSDIYSLGCTLFHMLTGAAPYPEGTVLQKLLDHQGKEPPDPAERNPRVSPQLSAVVKKMMASDPRRRYATPEDVIRDLMPVAAELGLRGVHSDGFIWTSPRLERRRFWERNVGWIATVAVLLLIVFLLDRFPGLGQQQPSQPGPSPQQNTHAADFPPEESTIPTHANGIAAADTAGRPAGEPSAADGAAGGEGGAARPVESAGAPAMAGTGSSPDDQQNVPDVVADANNQAAAAIGPVNVFDSTDKDLLPVTPGKLPTGNRPIGSQKTVVAPGPPRKANSPVDAPQPNMVARAPDSVDPFDTVPEPPPIENDRPVPISIVGAETDYLTLEAACADAQDGQIIELRYNGRRRGPPEKPLRVENKRITIRAGKDRDGNFYRPLVEFAAGLAATDRDTRMISLIGGSVELINVDIRVELAGASFAQEWALFWLQGTERADLKGVSITFVNPGAAAAAVFELKSGPGRDLANMDKINSLEGFPTGTEQESRIKIVNSFVRGDCDLFTVKHTQPGRFTVENSVLAVEGSLLAVIGDLDMPDASTDLELQLEHVTALIGNSLLRMDSGQESRLLLPVRISAENNIFATNTSSPLVAMTGSTTLSDFRTRLRWSGTNNFYDRFELFWSIAPTLPTADLEELDYQEWKDRWGSDTEVDPNYDEVVWEHAWRGQREFSELTLAQVALDDDAGPSPSAWEATDVGDVGADLSALPGEPPEDQ